MTKPPPKRGDDSTPVPERRLIKRKRLIPDRRYVIRATPENITIYKRPPADHPVYSLIGRIAMEWAIVENWLDDCIGLLADTNSEITACITAQMMGHAPRCLAIRALAHWRGLQQIELAAESLQNSLYAASDLRNRAIHDRIFIESKQKAAFKQHRMSKKELVFGLKEFDVSGLEKTVALIRERQGDCVKLLTMIRHQVYEYEP